MKKIPIILILAVAAFWGCNSELDNIDPVSIDAKKGKAAPANAQNAFTEFVVKIENVSQHKDFFASGGFGSGPAFPGEEYSFSFHAPPGSYLSFATMYVQSNDLFIGPGEAGIPLYDASGNRKYGDITMYQEIWDAGTEVDETLGSGPNQAPRQSGPNTGADENGPVVVETDPDLPAVEDVVEVSIHPDPASATGFTVTIKNISGSSSLPSPLAPGVYVVHTAPAPLFTVGEVDRGHGLEGVAEDGNNSMLIHYLAENTGLVSPFAPGLFVVQKQNSAPIFEAGYPDFGEGLEAIAEDGNPAMLYTSLQNDPKVRSLGIFNTPVGAAGPAPIFPGDSYEFTITAKHNDYLNFATMFIQSNDLFFAPDQQGVALFSGVKQPISGDITHYIDLWDAGTEVNEFPGAGPNQAPRQSGPDTGEDEGGVVQIVDDGYTYPAVSDVIRVTVTPL